MGLAPPNPADTVTEFFADVFTRDLLLAGGICVLGGMMHGYTGWGGGMVMMPYSRAALAPTGGFD